MKPLRQLERPASVGQYGMVLAVDLGNAVTIIIHNALSTADAAFREYTDAHWLNPRLR